jgi:hypothetical protein
VKNERGTTLPLLVGLSTLALAISLVLSEKLSLQQQSLRAKSEARFAALLVAKHTAGLEPVIGLDYSTSILAEFPALESLQVISVDGLTFEATACLRWNSPLKVTPTEVICQTARARTLRLPSGPMV